MPLEDSEWAGQEPSGELRRLLDLAEEVQERYEWLQRRSYLLRVWEATAVAAGAISFVVVASQSLWTYAPLSVIIPGVYVGAVEIVLGRNLGMRLKRERRALGEVVELVREVESSMAIKHRWSSLERAEFRIRLSRFDA